tara:strand:+ start:390 stop:695 length:306 start_codon:yes stop_codon:yes gene_type:complete
MTTGLTQISGLLNAHLGKPKPKRINWSGKVKNLVKKHPELEIRIELWDKDEYGNHYYIYFKEDIEEKILSIDGELNALVNNMEGVYHQLVERLNCIKKERG